MIRITAIAIAAASLFATAWVYAEETISRGRNLSADVATDGRVAIDLVGDIWIVPPSGGQAEPVLREQRSAERPRWSPDASKIAYQAISAGSPRILIHDFTTDQSHMISRDTFLDMHAAWHPDGDRLVYASDRTGSGFDLWEVDLPTGLHWRLSDRSGDETDPAWSANGRDLVYVHRKESTWSLVLRRRGLPEETLLVTTDRLAGPSWRPDGSLIAYVRKGPTESTIDMVILSQPRLIRPFASGEDFALAPASWFDRNRVVYTANGVIRQRHFNSWTASSLPFRATIQPRQPAAVAVGERRQLPRADEPLGRLIIRASRLFDGLGGGYQKDRDIVIERGRIAAIEPRAERSDVVVIDMGDLTVLPGYIDAHAGLPNESGDGLGPLLLTTGVTTVVADHTDAERLDALWSGKETPGPRLLSAALWPAGEVSGIADSMTPGLPGLLQSRQAHLIGVTTPVARRFAELPAIDVGVTSMVLGSKENGLPAGIALHAELRALVAAGLRSELALRAAGVNAAAALSVDPFLGRIAVGAAADLVFVDGDPLANIEDALKIVAVVRNGRFFSVAGLIDRANGANNVE